MKYNFVNILDKSRPFIGFTRFKIWYQVIEDGDVITFPEIRMDEENYFQSNQFVCPVNGYYYFLLNLARMKNVNIKVNLMHGNQKVFKLEDTQASNFYNTISNSVVIRCMKGNYFRFNNLLNVVKVEIPVQQSINDQCTIFNWAFQ